MGFTLSQMVDLHKVYQKKIEYQIFWFLLKLDDLLRYRAKGKVKSEFKLYVLAYFNIKN
jgi:hypothetical protein